MKNRQILFRLALLGIWLFGFTQTQATPLRIGIIKYKTLESVQQTYWPLLNYLGQSLGMEVEITIVPEDELAFKLTHQELDLGIFTPFPYLKAKLDFPELEVFASHTVQGQDSYSGCILVRKDSEIRSLGDLKGKKFSFVKPSSTSGFKYPRGIFKEHNLDIDNQFFSYDFSGGHLASVEALIQGTVDGIAIDKKGLDGLSVSETSQFFCLQTYEIPYHAYVWAPSVSEKVRSRAMDVMFKAHKNPTIRQAFSNPLGIEKWHRQDDTEYNSLRRYLGIVRVKPGIRVVMNIRPGAQQALSKQGDLVAIVEENILNVLKKTGHFSQVSTENQPLKHTANLNISRLGDQYHAIFYLDNRLLGETDLAERELRTLLPSVLGEAVVYHLPVKTELLTNGEDWFITYGTNDGIDLNNYSYTVIDPSGTKTVLTQDQIEEQNALNTFFTFLPQFHNSDSVMIQYVIDQKDHSNPWVVDSRAGEGFWDNLDNRWGVIGIVFAFITIAVGSYMAGIKKKRFRDMLHASNGFLLAYLRGEINQEQNFSLHQENMNRSLERGRITENQFLILTHRVDQIKQIVDDLQVGKRFIPSGSQSEVEHIMKDGVITEKEYTRIISLIKKRDTPRAT